MKISDTHYAWSRSELRAGQGPAGRRFGSFPVPVFFGKHAGGVDNLEGDQPPPSFRPFLESPATPPALS